MAMSVLCVGGLVILVGVSLVIYLNWDKLTS